MRKSLICSIILLLTIIMIESAIISNISFFPVVPDFVMICVIYLSLLNGKIYGETSGFFAGMVQDFLSGCPFGFHMLIRTVIGYFSAFFHGTLHFRGLLMPVVILFIATIAKCFLIWVISLFFPHFVSSYGIFSKSFLFEILFNSISAPILFKIFSFFDRFLALDKEEKF